MILQKNKFVSYLTVLSIGISGLIGCGGGGSDGSGGTTSLTYSGLNTPAVITKDNAHEIAINAYTSGETTGGLVGIASLDNDDQDTQKLKTSSLFKVSQIARGVVERIDPVSAPDQVGPMAIVKESESLHGSCGGNASFTIQVNDETGFFSGTLSFNGYCEGGVTINGDTDFSGKVDLQDYEMTSMTLRFDEMTSTSGSEFTLMEGEMRFDIAEDTSSITMDLLFQDSVDELVYKIENYQMMIVDQYSQTEIEISGRFFDPYYGFIEITTISTFHVRSTDEFPYTGSFVADGENGIEGGPTSVRLTAIDQTRCLVEADTDGDGLYDDYSETMFWTDF